MISNEKISGNQVFILMLGATIGTVFLDQPSWVVEKAGQDGWMAIPIGFAITVVIAIFAVKLGQLFPEQSIVEYLPLIIGKIPGKILAVIYTATFLLFSSIIVRISIEVLSLLMPETPPLVLSLLITVLIAYSAMCGLEVFARVSQFFVPLVFLGLFILSILSLNMADPSRLKPALEKGMMPVLKTVPGQIAFSGEAVLFMAFLFPWLREKKAIRPIALGIGLGALLLTLITISSIMVFGTKVLVMHNFPVYTQSRMILVMGFLHGFEGLLTLVWVTAAFIKSTVFFIPAVIGTARLLCIDNYRLLVIPLIILNSILSLIPENAPIVDALTGFVDSYLILPLTLLLPVLWIIANLRRRVERG